DGDAGEQNQSKACSEDKRLLCLDHGSLHSKSRCGGPKGSTLSFPRRDPRSVDREARPQCRSSSAGESTEQSRCPACLFRASTCVLRFAGFGHFATRRTGGRAPDSSTHHLLDTT